MKTAELQGFLDTVTKGAAMQPLVQPGSLRRATAKLMGHDMRTVSDTIPRAPKAGTFGIKTSTAGVGQPPPQYEEMDREKWKQTAKDLPLVVLAGAAGFGVGKTIGDAIGESLATRGVKAGPWARSIAPLVATGLSTGGAYMFGQTRERMRHRRQQASEKAAGVAPAPQSRAATPRKPSDPWKYDPRPAGEL